MLCRQRHVGIGFNYQFRRTAAFLSDSGPKRRVTTTESACLNALHEAAERLGESPTRTQYEKMDITPSSTTIVRIIGGWNEAKERAGLRTYSQGENGGVDIQPKPDSVTIPDETDWVDLTPQQRWYYRNRRHRINVKERRREDLREWFSRLKRDQFTCNQCDESRAAALDFHHPDSKQNGISQMVNHGYSKRRIREEIDRCTVLCANCHRREHADDIKRSYGSTPDNLAQVEKSIQDSSETNVREVRRSWVDAYKRSSDGCTRCDISDFVCLDFHHPDRKKEGIAKMLSQRRSLDEIRQEIANCVLLCANCHRIEHHTPKERNQTDRV